MNPVSAPNRLPRAWLFLLLAALTPAIFALSTNNIWEDYFITYRCSLNLAQGHGFVYEAGRRLHVFTSPLGTLLPAGISWLFQTGDAQLVLNLFRLLGCLVLAGAWGLAAGRSPGNVAPAVLAGFWLLDAKLAAYSTNGMETAFLVFFVVLTWRALVDGDMRLAGIALGGAMWTRPDGFVFVGALAIATYVLSGESRRDWQGWVRLAVWGVMLYAPWVLWAWWYYGSPVPHTILAKSTVVANASQLSLLVTYPFRLLFGHTAADDAFLPPYFFFGGWPKYLWLWGKALTLAALATAAWPRCARPARIAGLAFVLGGFYLEITPRAPWYFPAWEILAFLAIGGLVAALLASDSGGRRAGRIVIVGAAAVLIAIQAVVFVCVTVELRTQQNLIEWNLRAALGRDLRTWAGGRNDTVFLESLGYIGYFSGLAMRDTPGLCAPEVVALRRSGVTRMAALAEALDTDWVVLRDSEFAVMSEAERNRFGQQYRLWARYDMRSQVEAVAFLPGRDFLRFDAHFLLWRRLAASKTAVVTP